MPELNVSRKSLKELFTELRSKKFVIPDYQRPYKWDYEKCETLWSDILTFYRDGTETDYFLGTIVTCKEGDKADRIEIIDGQQRITSLLLLFRAFYRQLEEMQEDENVLGLKNQIGPCIWEVDSISQRVKDKTKIHIESLVATESDNDAFHFILETGTIPADALDLYSQNFDFFLKQCKDFARQEPLSWQPLCVKILDHCIVLPIECETVDTALTIFSTLNDRGLPLSDSDIFKSQIYKNQPNKEAKERFAHKWKELSEVTKDAKLELNDIFRYHSHVIRGREGDRSKEMALRKFYAQQNHSRLKAPSIMSELRSLADFWLSLQRDSGDNTYANTKSRQLLHCLEWYPNDYWKYATSVFFFANKDSDSFPEKFHEFLARLASFLYLKFVEKPTVNAIKADIYQTCIDLLEGKEFAPSINLSDEFLSGLLETHQWRISKGLILLHAYINDGQTELLPSNFEVEHIFPRAWQDTNYDGWDYAKAEAFLERYGNKVAIEKKINIQAGHGYFGQKKQRYANSKISDVIALAGYPSNDWKQQDITKRDKQFLDDLKRFFKTHLPQKD